MENLTRICGPWDDCIDKSYAVSVDVVQNVHLSRWSMSILILQLCRIRQIIELDQKSFDFILVLCSGSQSLWYGDPQVGYQVRKTKKTD